MREHLVEMWCRQEWKERFTWDVLLGHGGTNIKTGGSRVEVSKIRELARLEDQLRSSVLMTQFERQG